MMSQRSRRELLETVRSRYLKARKVEKQKILDELTAATGYHRKYAGRILKHGYPARKGKRKGRQAIYRGKVVQALEQIWEIYGHICSPVPAALVQAKRLHPYLPEGLKVLERCGEIQLSVEVQQLLLSISRSTIDRCLGPVRIKSAHGLSTTKPGILLRKAIAVRTFADWNEDTPGFMEIDLVAHCGETTEGQFLPVLADCPGNTLTCTDISTGWTEPIALRRRSQQAVCDALHGMRQDLPFPLLGIDCDNGGEFINDLLYRYCLDENITFTRSRPYKKNDQAHVEQKNWSVVRHTVGYDRLDTDEQCALLDSIYADLRLYINFFQPVLKLISKERIGNKVIRRYDRARTPYQRVIERQDIPLAIRARFTNLYVQLNPVVLRTSIDQKVAKLWKISK
jgi:hypothetical protein